jgi:hypothetical protein
MVCGQRVCGLWGIGMSDRVENLQNMLTFKENEIKGKLMEEKKEKEK